MSLRKILRRYGEELSIKSLEERYAKEKYQSLAKIVAFTM
jgi:hypothetical protein